MGSGWGVGIHGGLVINWSQEPAGGAPGHKGTGIQG